jgi:hypothetical protein
MGWACVYIGATGGAAYCGMYDCGINGWVIDDSTGAVDTGAQVAQGGAAYGAHVAASGAAYVGAGAQGGGQYGIAATGRLNQLHGQNGHSRAQQQPEAAGSVATANKSSIFFMVLCLLEKQRGDCCFGRVV